MFQKTFLLVIYLQCVFSARILFFSPMSSHSMRISQWPLIEALSEKGHDITFLSPLVNFEPDPQSKIKSYVPKMLAETYGKSDEEQQNLYEGRKYLIKPNTVLWYMGEFGKIVCQPLFSDPEFVKWVKSVKFDMVVVEAVMNECAYGLIHFWKAKLVIYGTSTVLPWFPDSFGLPDESSAITDSFHISKNRDQMTFYERFINAIDPIIFRFIREYSYLPALERMTREGLGEDAKGMPSFKEIERNCSLILVSTHFSIDEPRSLPPNVVPIGGILVTKKQKPIPPDMKSFINSAKNGFIYISFGTIVEFTTIEQQVQIEFVKALEKFPDIKFIWKLATEIDVVELPKNVFVTKWAPQQTLLAHPKIKAFITHSGMGSTMEAIHFSVPMICLPFFAEQDYNANMVAIKKAGIVLEIVGLKREQLETAINEILHNKEYNERMTMVTKVFKDRPVPPLENAVWWIEYVLRHDGINDFISPPNIHQSWWKRRQIDVWLVAVLIITGISLLSFFVIVKIIKLLMIPAFALNEKQKVKMN